MLWPAVLDELVPQCLHDAIEHRKRPAALEDPLGCLVMSRLALIALLAGREFKRHKQAAAALVCALSVFLVGHKEFQRGQKKRPKSTLLWFRAIEISPFEHANEELLGEILRQIGRITAPAQIGIQRVPVVLTQRNQGRPGFLSMWIARCDHQGPSGGRKLSSSRDCMHGLAV